MSADQIEPMKQRQYVFVAERFPLTIAQLHTEDYYVRPPLLMRERGWNVEIWSFFERKGEPAEETYDGLRVRRFNSWLALRNRLKRIRPDLVHVMAATRNNLLLAGAVPNMILTGQNLLLSSNPFKRWFQQYLRRKYDRIICLTPHELDWHARFMNRGALVRIPLSIDVNYFSRRIDRDEARRKFDLPKEAFVVIYVGNFREVKQLDKMTEGFACLRRRYREKECVLLVSGANLCEEPTKRKIENSIRQNNLRESVRFTGYLPPEEIRIAFSAADCQINYSTWEGQNLALYEGFCQGLPASLPKLEVFTSVFDECLYHESPEELANNLERLATDSGLYAMQSETHQKLMQQYDYRVCEKRILDLYTKIVGSL